MGFPVLNVDIADATTVGTILYFHGGGYAIGTATLTAGLTADIARRSGAHAISVDYRLAPEYPYPAGINDAVAAYRALLDAGTPAKSIVFACESAGGGLVLAA